MLRNKLMAVLSDMDKAAELFETIDFEIYFMGGAACILGGYTDRATRDFDFIDLEYDAKMGKIFALLRSFDMLEYESTILAPDYKSRAKRLGEIRNFHAYVLAPEDIVVSKIIRLADKDMEDIDKLMQKCDKKLINEIIDKVLSRDDIYPSKLAAFSAKLDVFREKYGEI